VGRLESNGETFDSSRDRRQIFMFRLGMGQVIEGWDVAIAKMSKGQIAELVIPASYAYGEQGYPPLIPRNSALIFEVELLDFSQKY
jgi:FKBP-type peptidyl-prolyl cis-trans isomerase